MMEVDAVSGDLACPRYILYLPIVLFCKFPDTGGNLQNRLEMDPDQPGGSLPEFRSPNLLRIDILSELY